MGSKIHVSDGLTPASTPIVLALCITTDLFLSSQSLRHTLRLVGIMGSGVSHEQLNMRMLLDLLCSKNCFLHK